MEIECSRAVFSISAYPVTLNIWMTLRLHSVNLGQMLELVNKLI
jgi:hypothetical protein